MPIPTSSKLDDKASPEGKSWEEALNVIRQQPGYQRLYWGRQVETPENVQLHIGRQQSSFQVWISTEKLSTRHSATPPRFRCLLSTRKIHENHQNPHKRTFNYPPWPHLRILTLLRESRERFASDRHSHLPIHGLELGRSLGEMGEYSSTRPRFHGHCRGTDFRARGWTSEGIYRACGMGECRSA